MELITLDGSDDQKAQSFIPFARRKMAELKTFMQLNSVRYSKKFFRFTTDSVEVFIESNQLMPANHIDKIRIKAVKIRKEFCLFTVDIEHTGGTVVDAVIFFDSSDWKNGFPQWAVAFDWGDNKQDTFFRSATNNWTRTHGYGSTGVYEATFWGWNHYGVAFADTTTEEDSGDNRVRTVTSSGLNIPGGVKMLRVIDPFVSFGAVFEIVNNGNSLGIMPPNDEFHAKEPFVDPDVTVYNGDAEDALDFLQLSDRIHFYKYTCLIERKITIEIV